MTTLGLTRAKICIQKIMIEGFTFTDLENYFGIRKNVLLENIKNLYDFYKDSETRYESLLNLEEKNHKVLTVLGDMTP